MPKARTSDGVELYYEVTGVGEPLLFIHEFAGDHRSWAPQIRHFAPYFQCIVYAARGFPPSDVPTHVSSYSQARAVEDAMSVLDAAGARKADVVGLSMGGFAALHLVLSHPERVRSALIGGVGYGAQPEKQDQFRSESLALAEAYETQGSAKVAETYALGPARVQLQRKRPKAWGEFAAALAEHDPVGAANTMRGVQATRPSLYDLRDKLRVVRVAMLIVAGDEDEGSIEPSIMLKRTIPKAGLLILPMTGHTLNLEEPEAFNQAIMSFIKAVDEGGWRERDPRATAGSITGVKTS